MSEVITQQLWSKRCLAKVIKLDKFCGNNSVCQMQRVSRDKGLYKSFFSERMEGKLLKFWKSLLFVRIIRLVFLREQYWDHCFIKGNFQMFVLLYCVILLGLENAAQKFICMCAVLFCNRIQSVNCVLFSNRIFEIFIKVLAMRRQ